MNLRRTIDGRRREAAAPVQHEVATPEQAPVQNQPQHQAVVFPMSHQRVPDAGVPSQHNVKQAIIRGALIVAVALILSAALVALIIGRGNGPTGYQGVDAKRYQAIFLSNGQVYFGKLSNTGSELVKLTDVWYLQVQQGTQSAEALKDNSKSQVSLAKMGNELHGPDDSMSIAKDQILFWENLKDNSKVVKAIKEAK